MSGVSRDAVAHRRRFPRRRQCGASLFGREECCTSRRRQKEEEDSETTLSSSRNPKMDLLAAAKMKTTATVTLFLTFLIAVGCSSAERNSKSRDDLGVDDHVDDHVDDLGLGVDVDVDVDARVGARVPYDLGIDDLLDPRSQEILDPHTLENLGAYLEARSRQPYPPQVHSGVHSRGFGGPSRVRQAYLGVEVNAVGLGVGKLDFGKVDVIYVYRGDLFRLLRLRRYNDDDDDDDDDDDGKACKVLLRNGVCNDVRGVTARGSVVANLDFSNEKITIIGKIIGKLPSVYSVPTLGTILYDDCVSGIIVNGSFDDLSIIINKDELNKDQLEPVNKDEHKEVELFGEYIAIEGIVTYLDDDRPGVLVSRVCLVERGSTMMNATMNATMNEASGEATGSLWIRAGIFSLTVLLAAAVALISWNLQKKKRPATKKLYIPKN